MKVIWKRPDGFHGAKPSDYYVVQVANNVNIWLHKSDSKNFPFRVSGGWQDEESTRKLNQLVNLLGKPEKEWLSHLLNDYHHSQAESSDAYLQHLETWIELLQGNLKGDNWEMIIMQEVLQELRSTLMGLSRQFTHVS